MKRGVRTNENRRILAKSNNERSFEYGGPMQVSSRSTEKQEKGGALGRSVKYGNVVAYSPFSNPEIPMKNPITKVPDKMAASRKTYQSTFARKKGCGGILKKKGCGGIMKCRGGKLKKSVKRK